MAAGLERLIVFAEGRYSNGDGCEVPNASAPRAPAATAEDPCAGYFRNIFWRLSDDGGATWSPIRRLAGAPNVVCKLSGVVTEADPANWSTADLRPYTDVVIEAFGPERVLFGSDWPVVNLASSWAGWARALDELTSDLAEDDQQRLFYSNAERFYRL